MFTFVLHVSVRSVGISSGFKKSSGTFPMLVDDGYKERGLSFDVSQVHFGPMLYQALDGFDIASCNRNKIFIYQKMSEGQRKGKKQLHSEMRTLDAFLAF